jgi:hypothetical protein
MSIQAVVVPILMLSIFGLIASVGLDATLDDLLQSSSDR